MPILLADAATIPPEFFTKESVTSLTAVVAMVTIVANGIQRIFNWNPVWLAWALAEVICFAGMLSTNAGPGMLDYLLTFVNGFLVFSAATGATSTGNALLGEKKPAEGKREILTGGPPPKPRGFFTPWFRS